MNLVQVRTVDNNEEGIKGHYYNYEFAFVDDMYNSDRRHVKMFVQNTYRYGHDDEDFWENDNTDNRPEDYGDYSMERYWVYASKKEIVGITTLEGDFED